MKAKPTLKPDKEVVEKERAGVVAQLAGLLREVEIKDAEEEYTGYLIKKYS